METLEELNRDLLDLMDIHEADDILECIKSSFNTAAYVNRETDHLDNANLYQGIADRLGDIINDFWEDE